MAGWSALYRPGIAAPPPCFVWLPGWASVIDTQTADAYLIPAWKDNVIAEHDELGAAKAAAEHEHDCCV
jgi:hypothetical protein